MRKEGKLVESITKCGSRKDPLFHKRILSFNIRFIFKKIFKFLLKRESTQVKHEMISELKRYTEPAAVEMG